MIMEHLIKPVEFHEFANIYRMLPEAELQKLAEDIKAKGQTLPITSYEGKILDGRNRFKACGIAGVDPRIEEYAGSDPLGLIASLNDHRRHDSENERALVGARMANLKHGVRADASTGVSGAPAISIERAAELSGSSRKSIERAKPIVTTGIPELQDMVDGGEVSIRAGSEVAKLPEEEQRKAVSGGAAGVKEAAKKSIAATPPKKERKPAIPSREDIARDHQRILGNLKSAWASAPTAIREDFLAWVEKNKVSTNA